MSGRCRVCHLATSDISLPLLVLPQVLVLKGWGYEVEMASGPGPNSGIQNFDGVPVHRVPLSRRVAPLSDILALLALVGLFNRGRYGIVHVHTPKAILLGQVAARLAGVPRVVNTTHGLYVPGSWGAWKKKVYFLAERFASLWTDVIFSVNHEDLDTMAREKIGRKARRIFLGNGIDVGMFQPGKGDRAGIRGSLGIPPDALVVGIMGRLVREKGYPELFEAMVRVREAVPKAWLLVVGPEEPEKPDAVAPEEARKVGLADQVVFAGFREDTMDLYSAMDVFCLPSHREGFPRTVMEASAMGLPVVATDIRGCREAVEHGLTGLLVPVKNPPALADSLLALLRSQDLRRKMSQAGRTKAERDFDERRVFEMVARTYEELLGS